MQKVGTFLAVLVVLVFATLLWKEHSRFELLRAESNQRVAKLDEEIGSLRAELLAMTRKLARLQPAPKEISDLPQIKGAIAELRRRAEDLEKKPTSAEAKSTNTPPAESFVYPDSVGRNNYNFAGFATAADATQSVLWSISKLDRKSFENTVAGEMSTMWQNAFQDLPPDVMPGGFKNGAMYRASGFKVLEEIPVSDTEVKTKVFLEGQNHVLKMIFKKVGTEWKWAGNY
jgi:hypothetical protein